MNAHFRRRVDLLLLGLAVVTACGILALAYLMYVSTVALTGVF